MALHLNAVCPGQIVTQVFEHSGHRLNQGSNRDLNAILYRIGLTPSRHRIEARVYLGTEAVRKFGLGHSTGSVIETRRRICAIAPFENERFTMS